MSKFFSYDYDYYVVVECHQNLNFEKIDTAPYAKKRWALITVRNI